MLLRVAFVCAGLLGFGALVGAAVAEELNPEQARAFVVGKLFTYNCFEGTAGMGRIFADGSVVGTIRIRGQGAPRFAALPAGTIRVDGGSMCAHLSGLPITPCFRVQKLDYRSFRGSLSGFGFAYCDFYQHNPRSQLTSERSEMPLPLASAVVTSRPAETPAATPISSTRTIEAPATPVSRPMLRPSLAE